MMPRISQAFVRASSGWLAAGFTFGATTLVVKASGAPSPLWALRETHIHALLVGWLIQFAAGIAYAIFPRLAAPPGRGDPRLAWLSLAALNLGAAAGTTYPVLAALGLAGPAGGFKIASGLLDLAALALFATVMWRRIRTVNPVWPPDLPVLPNRHDSHSLKTNPGPAASPGPD